MALWWMLLAAVAYVAGGYCMKLSVGFTQPLPSAALFLLFCAGAACQTMAMRHTEMGVAYILVLGLESLLAAFVSLVLLREHWDTGRIIAVLIILTGLVLLHRSGAR